MDAIDIVLSVLDIDNKSYGVHWAQWNPIDTAIHLSVAIRNDAKFYGLTV
jgi:hypothetical protein